MHYILKNNKKKELKEKILKLIGNACIEYF
jgi:hypothetical protein